MKNVLILGSGAIGSFYGGILHRSGRADVSIVTKSQATLAREQGLRIKSELGNFTFHPSSVFSDVSQCKPTYDLVIVTSKVLPSIPIVDQLKHVVTHETAILLIQNGIGIEDPIHQAFPKNPLLSALAFICVSRREHGVIDHQDYGRLVLGGFPDGLHDMGYWLQSCFEAGGISCKLSENIVTDRWKKLIWNAPFNPLSVVCGGKDTQQLLKNPHTLNLVRVMMKEVQAVAMSESIIIDDKVIEKNISDTLTMTPYKTSMLLDFENGRDLEVDAILGNCVRIANKNGVSIPHLSSVYSILSHY